MEDDPCPVWTLRNHTAGTGNRQSTSAQAKSGIGRLFSAG